MGAGICEESSGRAGQVIVHLPRPRMGAASATHAPGGIGRTWIGWRTPCLRTLSTSSSIRSWSNVRRGLTGLGAMSRGSSSSNTPSAPVVAAAAAFPSATTRRTFARRATFFVVGGGMVCPAPTSLIHPWVIHAEMSLAWTSSLVASNRSPGR